MDPKVLLRNDFREASQVLMTVFNGEGDNWNPEISLKHLEENYDEEYNYIVKDNDKIIGLIIAFPSSVEDGTYIFIDTIVVLEEYRGKGIGKILFNTVVEKAKTKGFKGILLLGNPSFKSYQWYKKMGFKEDNWQSLYKNFD